MSDYLSRAVDRIEPAPSAAVAVRPLLQPSFAGMAPVAPAAHHSDGREEGNESWSVYSKPDAAAAPAQPASHAVADTDASASFDFRARRAEPTAPSEPLLRIETIHHTVSDSSPAAPKSAPPSEPASPQPASPLIVERVTTREVSPAAPLLVERVTMRETAPAPSSPELASTVMPAVSMSRALESEAIASRKAPLETSAEAPQPSRLNSAKNTASTPSPAPLLGAVRTELPPDIRAPAAAPVPPTVNITIGRLEIRAATPAPERPRPQAPAGRGPLPLDEFLRHRSSRRPRA